MLQLKNGPKTSSIFSVWVVINALLFSLFMVGFMYGYLDKFLVDETYITHVIIGVTFFFIMRSGDTAFVLGKRYKTIDEQIKRYQNSFAKGNADTHKEVMVEALRSNLSLYRFAGSFLVGLGLLGTVYGISIAFSEVNPDVIADADASTEVMAVLLSGLATAFHTTLAGIVGMLWNMINLYLLNEETSRYYSYVISGEQDNVTQSL